MDDRVRAWAASGAMSLTGRRDGPPLGPPAPLVDHLARLSGWFRESSGALGTEVGIDGLGLLGERAAFADLHRGGETSCGGSARLLPAADGWMAVSLARPDDVASIPAWLELDHPGDDPWSTVAEKVARAPRRWLEDRAVLLGLPFARLPDDGAAVDRLPAAAAGPFAPLPVSARRIAAGPSRRDLAGVRVVDLSSLWAGPLCGSLLREAGAEVWKVESLQRPDGARRGSPGFFDLLNGGKASVAVDLAGDGGPATLASILRSATVVIESSRPRALRQLGIDPVALLQQPDGPKVWVSITGHGRDVDDGQRVAFGDDGAVAAGLVVRDLGGPCFCADAVADPITGLTAAVAALRALTMEGRWLLDVSLVASARPSVGETLDASSAAGCVAPARSRPVGTGARPLGADTEVILAGLGRR